MDLGVNKHLIKAQKELKFKDGNSKPWLALTLPHGVRFKLTVGLISVDGAKCSVSVCFISKSTSRHV